MEKPNLKSSEDFEQLELFPKPPHVERSRNEKIPISWFEASGKKGKGITRVDFSTEFFKKFNKAEDEDGGLDKVTLEYLHNYANQRNIFEAQSEEYKNKIKKIENNIKNVTEVSFADILEEKDYLQHEYWGKDSNDPNFKFTPDPESKPV